MSLNLGYRIKADGADETIQKLKALHEEVRSGTMTAKDYTKQHKELTLAGRASSQQFNDIKGAIAAANPNLMELNKTMSIFGGTANVAMSALNTINLALLSGSSAAQNLSQQYQKNADDYNAFIRLYESPQYGPGAPDTEAAYQKYQADLNSTSNLQKQLGVASIDTGISVTLSAVSMLGSMSQTYTALKAIQWGNVFAAISTGASSALGALTTFSGAVLLPLAVAVAAFEGAYYLIRALNPQYAQSMDELSGIIQKNWNVSSIEASLLAPFVGAYLGFASLEDKWREDLINFANSIINLLNTIPNAVNSLKIPGVTLGTIGNIDPTSAGNNSFYNQAIQDLNINQNGTNAGGIAPGESYGQYTSTNPLPGADTAGAPTTQQILTQLQALQDPSTSTASNTNQSNDTLVGIAAGISQDNQTSNQIYQAIQTGNAALGTLAAPLQQQTAAQDVVKNALQSGFTSLQTQLAAQQAALVTAQQNLSTEQAAANPLINANGSNLTASDFPSLMNAISAVNSAQSAITTTQNAIQQNQSQQTTLDNATSGLAPVLNSIGLSSSTGIGSIIAGALGDYAGVGGAGTSAADMANFAASGNYGIFTSNAINEGMPGAPSQATQISDWLAANPGFTAAQASQALGYTSGSSTGTYDPSSAFGGSPGEYGNPSTPASALGNFLGPTSGNSSGGVSVVVNNNIQGSLLSQQDLNNTIQTSVQDSLLGVGWG